MEERKDICEGYERDSVQQLDKLAKDKNERFPIYPLTYIQAVYDARTKERLDSILWKCNNVYLPWMGSAGGTRIQLPFWMRRKGIYITYKDLDGNVITERCINDDCVADHIFRKDDNWILIGDDGINPKVYFNRYGYNVTVFGLKGGVHTLVSAIKDVPPRERILGQKITFAQEGENWVTYQFQQLSLSGYENPSNWKLVDGIQQIEGDINITNHPDEEDITTDGGNRLKLADKEYDTSAYSGMGRIYLRKNIQDVEVLPTSYLQVNSIVDAVTDEVAIKAPTDTELTVVIGRDGKAYAMVADDINKYTIWDSYGEIKASTEYMDSSYILKHDTYYWVNGVYYVWDGSLREAVLTTVRKNVLTQHMMSKSNTIYIIQYDYCLAGQTIEVPENCVLDFQGGSLRNGVVILNETSLVENGSRIFDNINLSGILNGDLSCTMFGASPSSSKDLNLDSIKETIKQLDNVGGGELLIPQEINYGYERNTPSTWVYTTVSNNIIVKDESKGNTYNLPSRDGSQIRNFFMTEGNPMDGQHNGGGFMVRANWHPYMMLSNDRDPVEANNRRATYFVGNNGKICWGIGQGSNTIEPDGTDRDDALSNFKIVGNDIAGGNGLTNMMVINKTNAFFGFNLSTPAQDYHFNFRNVEGRDNANVHFDASLRSGTLEILLTAGEAKKRIGVSPITNNLYFASDGSIVTSITRNGDILLKGNLGLFTGEGDPNGVFSCGIGALYQNRTVRANGKGLYVCTDTANKKFNLVSGVDSCTSTSRPSTTNLPVGFPTFDTTLGKPIWWTGSNWVDATGATV